MTTASNPAREGSIESTRARLHVHIPPDARHARTVRDALLAFGTLHAVAQLDLEAMLFAVGEALANAIEHGSPQGEIVITVEIDPHLISARVADHGRGFAGAPSGLAPLPDGLVERGRGIPIMQRCADLCEVESTPGDGTIVTLGRFRRDSAATHQEHLVTS
jgi:anti-sigma regulatory factor (Ser/Thr protein kinase)